jgi:soluble lytic murein transglycosylase-like protein
METLILLFASVTAQYNLPVGLLSALCFTESGHNVAAIHHDDGNGDSLGICQVKLQTARLMGFKGTQKELMSPKVNIKYSAIYLRKQLSRYGENSPMAVAAYNSGTFRPGAKFAKNQHYVDKVFKAWADGK